MTTPRVRIGRWLALAALLVSLGGCGDGGIPRAGDPDPTFGVAGEAIVDLGADRWDLPAGIAVLPDDRIIVGGSSCAGDCAFAVTRTLPDGSLDSSFGTGGFTLTHIGPIGYARAEAMAVQPDGKTVLVGAVVEHVTSYTDNGFGLARYLPDGGLDPSFGDGGVVVTRPRSAPIEELIGGLLDVVLQPDGKIVAVGYLYETRPEGSFDRTLVIARYHTDGALDRSFGTDGLAVPDLPLATHGNAIVLQSSGRIVASGGLSDPPFNGLLLVGFDRDGRVDRSFGDAGAVITPVAFQRSYANLALAENDAIVAASGREIHRHDADGRLAPGFGGPITYDFNVRGITVVGDHILAAGPTDPPDFELPTYGLLRLRSDGTPDPTFAIGGFTRTTTRSFHNSGRNAALAVDSRGRIVVAGVVEHGGAAGTDLLLARFFP